MDAIIYTEYEWLCINLRKDNSHAQADYVADYAESLDTEHNGIGEGISPAVWPASKVKKIMPIQRNI